MPPAFTRDAAEDLAAEYSPGLQDSKLKPDLDSSNIKYQLRKKEKRKKRARI